MEEFAALKATDVRIRDIDCQRFAQDHFRDHLRGCRREHEAVAAEAACKIEAFNTGNRSIDWLRVLRHAVMSCPFGAVP